MTFAVTNTFTGDTSAVASEVNTNFTDLETELNAFPTDGALADGAVSTTAKLANNIITSPKFHADALVTEAEGLDSSDNDTSFPTTAAVKDYVDTEVTGRAFGEYSRQDSDSANMIKDHAYLANQDGHVTATALSTGVQSLVGYIGSTNDPAGAGDEIQNNTFHTSGVKMSIYFPVASGKYFEITHSGSNEPTIYWHPVGTLSKPTDQEA